MDVGFFNTEILFRIFFAKCIVLYFVLCSVHERDLPSIYSKFLVRHVLDLAKEWHLLAVHERVCEARPIRDDLSNNNKSESPPAIAQCTPTLPSCNATGETIGRANAAKQPSHSVAHSERAPTLYYCWLRLCKIKCTGYDLPQAGFSMGGVRGGNFLNSENKLDFSSHIPGQQVLLSIHAPRKEGCCLLPRGRGSWR